MTGSYGLIVPLMLVCFSSYMIGRRWGISDEQVPSSVHSPTHAGDSVLHLLDAASVAGAMNRSWPLVIAPHASLNEIIHKAELGTCPEFVVVEEGQLQGVISIMEIREYMESPALADMIIAADLMTTDPWTVTADDSLSQALGVMAQSKRTAVPVVRRPRGREFIGMITAESVYRAIRDQLDQMKTHLFAEHGELAVIESEETFHQLALGTSLASVNSIQRLMVPLQVIGRSLRESDFRSAFGIQVIAIEYPDGSIQCPPDVNAPLRTNQRLIGIVASPPTGGNDE
jgi:CBS domain-containing protein